MKYAKHTVVSLAVTMLLAACGGGGGGGSPSGTLVGTTPTTPAQPTTPAVTPADLQTSIPALTYSAGSQEYAFVTALNQFRQQVGLGLWAQSSMLDKSAQNHLQYIVTNNAVYGGTVDMNVTDAATGRSFYHVEQAGKPNFTGVVPTDRAKVVNYSGSVGEEIAFSGGNGAQAGLTALIGSVYHRAGLMDQGSRDVGVAVGQDTMQTITLEYGSVNPQANASDFFGIYPADKQTGVGLYTSVEAPNPFPDLSTSNSDYPTKTGYPISVVSKEGTTLEVVNWTVTEAGAASNISARLKTASNDANKLVPSNMAFLVANERFKQNTTYNVSFSGRVNNVVVTKAWSFTTGN